MSPAAEKPERILVIDDDPEICKLLERYLGREGYRVHSGGDGEAMYRCLAQHHVDLIVLDLRLPGKDGLTLAQELRRDSPVAIIMLTEKTDVIDRIVGLESGADDYLPKPFHPRELLARIRSVLRRAGQATHHRPDRTEHAPVSCAEAVMLGFDGWHLCCQTRQLFSPARNEVPLTPAEFELLYAFLQHPNRVLDRDFLLDLTRGRSATPFDRAIDVHVSHLRKKLEPDPQKPHIIKTVRNAGYMFVPTVERL